MGISAMYPGTFDPITNGHHELVRRAARLFERVVVAVAASPHKAPVFDLEERIGLARQVLADIPNVSVDGYQGLTVEYARQHDLKVVIRGLRAVSDFEYEFQMAQMNRQLWSEAETVFLTPDVPFAFLSASLVREVAALGGDVSAFVSPPVLEAMRRKLGGEARKGEFP